MIIEAQDLVNRSGIAMLGTVDEKGYPNIKAMMKMENEGLKYIWFCTNTDSNRVIQLQANPKSSVYFVDFEKWMGLMLIGTMEIRQDVASKHRLWHEGFDKYYPRGIDDPDYTVLRFTATEGHFYHALSKLTFEINQIGSRG